MKRWIHVPTPCTHRHFMYAIVFCYSWWSLNLFHWHTRSFSLHCKYLRHISQFLDGSRLGKFYGKKNCLNWANTRYFDEYQGVGSVLAMEVNRGGLLSQVPCVSDPSPLTGRHLQDLCFLPNPTNLRPGLSIPDLSHKLSRGGFPHRGRDGTVVPSGGRFTNDSIETSV